MLFFLSTWGSWLETCSVYLHGFVGRPGGWGWGWFQVGGRWEVNDLEIRTSLEKNWKIKTKLGKQICKESCWICKECSFPKFGSFLTISVFLLEPLLCIIFVSWNSPWLKWWTSFTCSQFFLASLGKEKKRQLLESCKQFTLFPIIVMVRNFTLIWRKLILETSHFPLPRSTRTVDKAPGQQTHSVSCWQPIWRRKNPDFQWSERIKLLEN